MRTAALAPLQWRRLQRRRQQRLHRYQSLAAPPIASPQLALPPAPLSWLGMFYGETDEEYTERMRDPGRQVLSDEDEYTRLIKSFPESRSQRAARAPSGRGLEGNRRTSLRGGRSEELRQDAARQRWLGVTWE